MEVGATARALRGTGEDDVRRGMGTALVPFLLQIVPTIIKLGEKWFILACASSLQSIAVEGSQQQWLKQRVASHLQSGAECHQGVHVPCSAGFPILIQSGYCVPTFTLGISR